MERSTLNIIQSGNKCYLKGLKKDSSWEKKLIAAGSTKVASSGDLLLPEGNAKKFINDTLGEASVKKYVDVVFDKLEKSANKKQGKPTEKKETKSQLDIVQSGNKCYLKGLKKDSSWEKKLIAAGSTKVASSGDLLLPEGNAKKFINKTIGKESLSKYGVEISFSKLEKKAKVMTKEPVGSDKVKKNDFASLSKKFDDLKVSHGKEIINLQEKFDALQKRLEKPKQKAKQKTT